MKLNNVSLSKNSNTQAQDILKNEGTSKSQKMKDLFQLGYEIKDIASLLNVRYNFVYNVISNQVITEGLEVESVKRESKKDVVVELFKQGKSNKEIAIELKTNYNYIYKIVKEYKDSLVVEESAKQA